MIANIIFRLNAAYMILFTEGGSLLSSIPESSMIPGCFPGAIVPVFSKMPSAKAPFLVAQRSNDSQLISEYRALIVHSSLRMQSFELDARLSVPIHSSISSATSMGISGSVFSIYKLAFGQRHQWVFLKCDTTY